MIVLNTTNLLEWWVQQAFRHESKLVFDFFPDDIVTAVMVAAVVIVLVALNEIARIVNLGWIKKFPKTKSSIDSGTFCIATAHSPFIRSCRLCHLSDILFGCFFFFKVYATRIEFIHLLMNFYLSSFCFSETDPEIRNIGGRGWDHLKIRMKKLVLLLLQ